MSRADTEGETLDSPIVMVSMDTLSTSHNTQRWEFPSYSGSSKYVAYSPLHDICISFQLAEYIQRKKTVQWRIFETLQILGA